jgi:hypothetical protein
MATSFDKRQTHWMQLVVAAKAGSIKGDVKREHFSLGWSEG